MPTFYDEEGNEVENLIAQEEADKLVEELKQKAEMTEQEKKELEELRKKDLNFSKLRKSLNEKKEEPKELPKEIPKEEPIVKKEEPKIIEEIDSLLDKDADEEEKAKAYYFYNQLAKDVVDPTLKRAFAKISIQNAKMNLLSSASDDFNKAMSVNFSSPQGKPVVHDDPKKEMGRSVFGLKDEDYEKYGKKDWKPNYSPLKK